MEAGEPVQEIITGSVVNGWSRELHGYLCEFIPVARYIIRARVLHRKRYITGWERFLSPVDLVLGWGPLEPPGSDRGIEWSQDSRWYHYRVGRRCHFTAGEVGDHSANVHIIPASKNLKRAILRLHRDDIVTLKGMLVHVRATRGKKKYYWTTSTSRTDRGGGSCELFWVLSMEKKGRLYR